VAPVHDIRRISPRPVLLIHGAGDQTISVEDSRLIRAAAGRNCQLWVVPGAGHCQAYGMHHQQYVKRVIAFWKRALHLSAAAPA